MQEHISKDELVKTYNKGRAVSICRSEKENQIGFVSSQNKSGHQETRRNMTKRNALFMERDITKVMVTNVLNSSLLFCTS